MKLKAILLGLFISMAGASQAQTAAVVENEQAVNGVSRRGQQLTVQLDPKFVEKYWKNHLTEEAGKVKQNKGVITVEGAVIEDISSKPMRVVSTIGSDSKGSYIWWSLDTGSDALTDKESKAAKDFLGAFATKLYREDVLLQINKAQDVVRDTEKEQDRVYKEAETLQAKIARNQERKHELELEMQQNKVELAELENSVHVNKVKQQESKQRVAEMRKALDAVRAKLSDIK